MELLIEEMMKKRLSTSTPNTCYNHAAYLMLPGKNKCNFQSFAYYGENSCNVGCGSQHAEMHAVQKVSQIHSDKARKRHKKEYIMVVIRVSKTNTLLNSEICKQCIHGIYCSSINTGIKIKKIYYSDVNGAIRKTTLKKLQMNENPFVSSFNRHCGYKSIYDKISDKNNKNKH